MSDIPKNPAVARLGRTAFAVHFVALVCAGLSLFVASLIFKDRKEWAAVLATGGAAAAAFYCWAVILSARAVLAGESWHWPYALFAASLFEVGGIFIWFGVEMISKVSNGGPVRVHGVIFEWALPVLVPFLTIGTAITLPLTGWLLKRLESRSGKRWTREQLNRRGLLLFAGLMTVSALIILPVPLFLLSAIVATSQFDSAAEYYGIEAGQRSEPSSWQHVVLRKTPDFIRDAVESAAPQTSAIRCLLLMKAAVSKARIIERSGDTIPAVRESAMIGLHTIDRAAYMERAVELLKSSYRGSSDDFVMLMQIVKNQPVQDVEKFFADGNVRDPWVFTDVFMEFLERDRESAMRCLEGMIESQKCGPVLQAAMEMRAQHSQSTAFIERMLNHPDRSTRMSVATSVSFIQSDSAQARIIELCISHPDRFVRVAFWQNVSSVVSGSRVQLDTEAIKVVNGTDLVVRRAAIHGMGNSIEDGPDATPTWDEVAPGGPDIFNGGKPVVESISERTEAQRILDDFLKWFEFHHQR